MNEQILTGRPTFPARLNMAHPLTKGLVGCWVMNDPAGMRVWDSSPYGNHGLVTGAVGNWQGRRFGGADFIGLGTYGLLVNHGSATSILALINHWNSATQDAIVATAVDSGAGYFELRKNADHTLNFAFYETATTSYPEATGTTVMPANTDIFVGATYDQTNIKLLINGQVEKTVASDKIMSASASELRIGKRGATTFFHGRISLVLKYSRALSLAEYRELWINPYDMFER